MRKGSDNACFFSANSCQRAKTFGKSKEGKDAELNYRLGTQLPYMMVMNRLAHYLKVLQREQIGSWKEKDDLNRELNKWISQYVLSNPASAGEETKAKYPLSAAEVTVEEIEGNPGYYSAKFYLRPHYQLEGLTVSLRLVSKLPSAKGGK
jgi:type VI secretion system protein ImpC